MRAILTNRLREIAVDMITSDQLPPTVAKDWGFTKAIPKADRERALSFARLARIQTRRWAAEINNIRQQLNKL